MKINFQFSLILIRWHNDASPNHFPSRMWLMITGERLMSFVVKKAIQEYAKRKGLKVSSGFYEAIDKEILILLEKAYKRCDENKRKTLMAYDI